MTTMMPPPPTTPPRPRPPHANNGYPAASSNASSPRSPYQHHHHQQQPGLVMPGPLAYASHPGRPYTPVPPPQLMAFSPYPPPAQHHGVASAFTAGASVGRSIGR